MTWRPRSRPASRTREPARLGRGIGRVLGELGIDLERSLRVDRAFREALGPELAPHFELVDLRGRTLEVRADSSVSSQELKLRSPQVLARLAVALGPDAPTEIRLRVR
jgi:predicted nucleic acid-binding Zn ribbon protein